MNLAVILSNRCNLLCRYCAVLLNEGPAHYLDGVELCRGIDHYLDGADGKKRGVTYLGGEPLLRFDVVRKAILHVRRRAPHCRQYVYTNGLLLTRPIFDFLEDQDVGLVLSIDGRREDNDRFRVAYKNPKQSAWRAAMARLEGLPIDKIRVNMVFTPETVSNLVENVDFLRRMGFACVDCGPDVSDVRRLSAWGPPAIKRLKRAASDMRAYLLALEQKEGDRFEFAPFRQTSGRGAAARLSKQRRDFEGLVLGADGRYYTCETLLGRPYETLEEFSVGSVERGIDWPRREALKTEARDFTARAFPETVFFSCPLKVYVYAKQARLDPGPLIRGVAGVFEAFHSNG